MQLDEVVIMLVAQEFKVPFAETKRLLHLMILGVYGGRRAAKAVWNTSRKKDKALRMKKRYLELTKPPSSQVKADEELARLKNKRANIEQRAAEKEAAKNLADEKARLRKEIYLGEVKLGGAKLILETLEDPFLHKRFITYRALKGFTPQRALIYLGCTLRDLLANVDDYYYDGIDPVGFIADFLNEKLPDMQQLEARLYMRDHFPSKCPECGRNIKADPLYTTPQRDEHNIVCNPEYDQKRRHERIIWRVKCPNCESWMNPLRSNTDSDRILIALACPGCEEIWRKGRDNKWPKKYCYRVVPRRKKEKYEEFAARPWTPLRNFLRFNPNDIIAEINRPASEDIIDKRVIFYIRELTASGATEINFKEAAKKLGIHPNQVFYSWKRLRDKGLVW